MFFAALSGTYGVEQTDDSDGRLSVDLTGAVVPADFITINFQGGHPRGYHGLQPWINTAFTAFGELRAEYLGRIGAVLDRLGLHGELDPEPVGAEPPPHRLASRRHAPRPAPTS